MVVTNAPGAERDAAQERAEPASAPAEFSSSVAVEDRAATTVTHAEHARMHPIRAAGMFPRGCLILFVVDAALFSDFRVRQSHFCSLLLTTSPSLFFISSFLYFSLFFPFSLFLSPLAVSSLDGDDIIALLNSQTPRLMFSPDGDDVLRSAYRPGATADASFDSEFEDRRPRIDGSISLLSRRLSPVKKKTEDWPPARSVAVSMCVRQQEDAGKLSWRDGPHVYTCAPIHPCPLIHTNNYWSCTASVLRRGGERLRVLDAPTSPQLDVAMQRFRVEAMLMRSRLAHALSSQTKTLSRADALTRSEPALRRRRRLSPVKRRGRRRGASPKRSRSPQKEMRGTASVPVLPVASRRETFSGSPSKRGPGRLPAVSEVPVARQLFADEPAHEEGAATAPAAAVPRRQRTIYDFKTKPSVREGSAMAARNRASLRRSTGSLPPSSASPQRSRTVPRRARVADGRASQPQLVIASMQWA